MAAVFAFCRKKRIFGKVKDTNKPSGMPNLFEHSRGVSIFGEAKDTNKRGQKQIHSHFAEREYLQRS
ncbi:hypothetical protein [uncultured Alistipes sp.]|uniref:hypothetical protein n=1 Tax=uncultured Alistipes sp. TaxID=538949 RepID=UPI00265AD1E7|nr:hypothetical protein [uncultured Alistipes sp.]